jgi:GTP-dependent phosphoenolpyruvate carboxykinase
MAQSDKSQCTDVRPYGTKNYGKEQSKQTPENQGYASEGIEISIRFIKRDRWHNLMEISMYGRTDFVRPYEQKKCYKQTQTNTRKPWGNTSEGIEKRDRWHNLMEISMYGRTDFVRPYRTKNVTKQTQTQKKMLG